MRGFGGEVGVLDSEEGGRFSGGVGGVSDFGPTARTSSLR